MLDAEFSGLQPPKYEADTNHHTDKGRILKSIFWNTNLNGILLNQSRS